MQSPCLELPRSRRIKNRPHGFKALPRRVRDNMEAGPGRSIDREPARGPRRVDSFDIEDPLLPHNRGTRDFAPKNSITGGAIGVSAVVQKLGREKIPHSASVPVEDLNARHAKGVLRPGRDGDGHTGKRHTGVVAHPVNDRALVSASRGKLEPLTNAIFSTGGSEIPGYRKGQSRRHAVAGHIVAVDQKKAAASPPASPE